MQPSPLNPNSGLWEFAQVLYAQPQVAKACVDLQDNHGVNVCLLLGLCWLDKQQRHLSQEQLAQLERHIDFWTRECIEPLRRLRRTLAVAAPDELQQQVRRLIKQAELTAEQKLLLDIEAWAADLAPKPIPMASRTNLEAYLSNLGVDNSRIAALPLALRCP
jgi:uncharacterized protein (TIGR02444 family)